MQYRLASAAPAFAFDEEQTIVAWHRGAEDFTGIAAADAVGQPCWVVLAGRADSGALMCHRQCSRARLARAGWPVRPETMNIAGADGPRRIVLETVSVLGNGSSLFLHLLRDAPAAAASGEEARRAGPRPRLTPRQLEVLQRLSEGFSARAISAELGVAEATVRNHIRAVLRELGAHSQLEAVFRARSHDLV
jgi:DNA-binding CsgD family transcriptional regulator